MGKSPLTGYWGDANSGGDFANALKASGYDIVFFEGTGGAAGLPADRRTESAELKDAPGLWGKDTAATEELIREENGNPRTQGRGHRTGGGAARAHRGGDERPGQGRRAVRPGSGHGVQEPQGRRLHGHA